MAKFKMKMELQGFKLEIEGEREDIPLIAQNVGQQLVGMMEPASNIALGETVKKQVSNSATAQQVEPKPKGKGTRKSGGSKSSKEPAVDWAHNPEKWGSPDQEWNPTKKAIWLLYVVSNETDVNQMSASRIGSTFNKHFKTSGTILSSNVSRDLGKAKTELKPSPVGQDTQNNDEYFLTDTGKKMAASLAAEARGEPVEQGLYNGTGS